MECFQIDEDSLESVHFKNLINQESLNEPNATHVICGIEWGAIIVISFEYDLNHYKSDVDKKQVDQNLKKAIQHWKLKIAEENANVENNEKFKQILDKTTIKFFTDLSDDDCVVIANDDQARTLMKKNPEQLIKCNAGLGIPLKFHLIKLEKFTKSLELTKQNKRVKFFEPQIENLIVSNFDEYIVHKTAFEKHVKERRQFDYLKNKADEVNFEFKENFKKAITASNIDITLVENISGYFKELLVKLEVKNYF